MSNKFVNTVKNVVDLARNKIADLAKQELKNADKKKHLDDYMTRVLWNLCTNPFSVQGILIKHLILPNVSKLTQIIYDLLETRIANVTAKATKKV